MTFSKKKYVYKVRVYFLFILKVIEVIVEAIIINTFSKIKPEFIFMYFIN